MKFRYLSLFLFAVIFGLFVLQSCIKKNDPLEEDYVAGEDVAFTESLVSNIFDLVADVAAVQEDTTKGIKTIAPASIKIVYTDSLYNDGDGVEYYIKFNTLNNDLSGGTECRDARTRGGILYITQTAKYSAPGMKITAELRDDSTAHHLGGALDIVRITGKVVIARQSTTKFLLSAVDCKAKFPQTGTVSFSSEKSITMITDTARGIWGDVYNLGGTGKGTSREGDAYTWFIATTVQKNVQDVCSRTYLTGLVEVRNTVTENSVTINFDPQFKKECDRVFSVALANGTAKTYKVN